MESTTTINTYTSLVIPFKFPTKSLPTVKFAAKSIRASCSSCGSYAYGRREILSLATASFLVPCCVNAAEGGGEIFVIREEIKKVISKAKAAGLLRLVFHDAGTFDIDEKTGGINGSIIYELERPENQGLKKSLKILEKAKSQVDAIQQDMIALAGAEAVSVCGGPTIPVQLGRIDSMDPDPEGRLPEESLDAPALKLCFKRKGFSTRDLVALSGAHTIGSKGFGSPVVFDNSYYKILLEKPWLSSGGMSSMIGLPSDRALVDDDECRSWITKYAENQKLFFQDFETAYIKLVNTGAKWRNSLELRLNGWYFFPSR